MRNFRKLAFASVSLISIAMPAYAQDAAEDNGDEQIVVTGSLIRGVAPAGAQQFTTTAAEIEAQSVQSTGQLMAKIPQLSSFGTLQTVNSGAFQLTVNRTNIRNLPQSIGGSSPTLILLDGHRIVGMGVKQSYPDPDVIPPFLIQRVEILTDGGSASYGSDAVGGVINFITKRDFDGVQVGARQSLGNDFRATDVNLAVGKSWETGSVYLAYNYARHNAVFGRSRDFIQNIDWTTRVPVDRSCSPANVLIGTAVYAVVGGNTLQPGTANACDRTDNASFYPKESRHAVMGGFRQDISDSLEFEVKGYYSERRNLGDAGPLQGTASVTATNPNYISIGGGNTATQSLGFDFGPVGGYERANTRLWSYGITPSVTWKMGGDWQLKTFLNYGQSKTTAISPSSNATVLGARVADGTINPYNVARSNPAAIASVLDWTNYGIGKASVFNAKATADGPVFSLPGGELRVAAGVEYIKEKYSGTTTTNTNALALAVALPSAERNVKSVFGEASIPLVGPEMNWPIHSIDISASVRFDDYSDFGSNWAPNVGVSLKPVEWINLRARWNKSFQAPSIVNLSQAGAPTVGINPGFILNFVPLLRNPAVPVNGGPLVAIQGTVSPLSPQRARNYNLGIDISPPFIEGLNLHATYFNIDYRGTIGQPALGFGAFYDVPAFQSSFIMLPTIAQIQSFLAARGVSDTIIATTVAGVNAQGGNAYAIADVRQRNLGVTKIKGWDFGFEYRTQTGFGAIYSNFNSTLVKSSLTAADGTNFRPDEAGLDGSKFTSTLTLGAEVGDNFRGQLTWTHRGGYRLSAPAQLGQTTVGAFNPIDLFLEYDLEQGGLPPITLTLGVDNMFNKAPPIYRASSNTGSGYANGSPLGRVFHLGASVKF